MHTLPTAKAVGSEEEKMNSSDHKLTASYFPVPGIAEGIITRQELLDVLVETELRKVVRRALQRFSIAKLQEIVSDEIFPIEREP
jgi:hypothetical protein